MSQKICDNLKVSLVCVIIMDGKIVQQPIQIVIQGQGPTRSLRSRPSAKVKAERLKKLFPARIVGVLASMQVVFFLSAATIQVLSKT